MTARQCNLGEVLAALVESGIQVALITSLPTSVDVHIGDERRGPVGVKTVKPDEFATLTAWFIEAGRKHYPKSAFASIEWASAGN